MDIAFGVFRTEVPDDWVDMSTITYAIPPKAGLNLGGGQFSEKSPGNISIAWQPSDGGGAQEYLKGREEVMAQHLPGFKVVERGDIARDGTEHPFVAYTFHSEEHGVSQMMFAKEVGNFIVVATGTALLETIDQVRDDFMRVARQIRLVTER